MRARSLWRALVAVVVCVAVVPVGLASAALPEFWKNGARLNAGEAIGYSSTNTNSVIKNLGFGQSEITCTTGAAAGRTNGPTKIQQAVIKFTGCKNQATASCHSRSGGAGEIITESLRGKLGYLKSGAMKPAGISFEPENALNIFLEYRCTGNPHYIQVHGASLGEVPTTMMEQTTWEGIFSPNNMLTAEKWLRFEEEGGVFELKAGCSTVLLKDKEEMTWAGGAKIKIEGS